MNNIPKRFWIVFFSQTGTEIVDLAKALNRWPDLIVTNKRPKELRTINPELEGKVVFVENKPTTEELKLILRPYKNPIISLHGWLRIMPEGICKSYSIYNGHPGLIVDYPELKGKDPQVRTYKGIQKGIYETAGCVIHKVTPGVDEGSVESFERFNTHTVESLDDLFDVLRDRSLYLWVQFFKSKAV